jgi:predicted enzyme related to lactoylglutathione lyase
MPGATYTLIKPGSGPGGGLLQHPMPGAPSMWLPYVGVDDIKASTEKARSLGAHVLVEPQEIPNIGWFSIFQDPTGATLALFKAK